MASGGFERRRTDPEVVLRVEAERPGGGGEPREPLPSRYGAAWQPAVPYLRGEDPPRRLRDQHVKVGPAREEQGEGADAVRGAAGARNPEKNFHRPPRNTRSR